MDFAKECSGILFGTLCFFTSIISLGYNLAFLSTLVHGGALDPALGIFNRMVRSIHRAQIKSAGTPFHYLKMPIIFQMFLWLMVCCAALSAAVTTGLILSGCVSQSESELWQRAPIFIGPVIFAAWSLVIAPNLGGGGDTMSVSVSLCRCLCQCAWA